MPSNETEHAASARVRAMLRDRRTFQISVDVDNIAHGLSVAEAALKGGVDLVEMGTPLLKFEGVHNVVPAFRKAFPEALLLADMKTMDGGGGEATKVFAGGGNIIDFLAASGVDTARAVCAARDEFRAKGPMARLAFADILVPQQGPAEQAIEVAHSMIEAGVDGVGIHLQLDARRADPRRLIDTNYIAQMARAVHGAVAGKASVQVVGGLSIAQAVGLAKEGLRAFVISGNFGVADAGVRFGLPPAELERLVADFIAAVKAA